MRTHRSLDFYESQAHVVALGCFDGVHIGHTELIRRAKRIATEHSLPLAVFSFEEPPRNFFCSDGIPIITPFEEKKRIMRSLGTDLFVCARFDSDIAELSAEQFFVEILKKRLKASHLVCGFNYRFGKSGAGDTLLLQKLCDGNGVTLSVVPPVAIDGITASSSEIRKMLADGNVEAATRLLGRPYSIASTVIDGQHLGRTLGFPTVNQLFEHNATPLKNGVYATQVRIGHSLKRAITNVGVRPTVDGHTLCAETNIFDFDGDLYGKRLRVEFIDFIRPERKFNSVAELSDQVHKDIDRAKIKNGTSAKLSFDGYNK